MGFLIQIGANNKTNPMKIDNVHKGKLFEYERERKYQEHLDRMNRIAAKKNSIFM